MAVRQPTWGPSPSSATDPYSHLRDHSISPISPNGQSRSPHSRPSISHSSSYGSRGMSISDLSPNAGTPILLPHGYLPFGPDRRHSYSNSDLSRTGPERQYSVDTTWEASWGERPRSSTGFYPPTPTITTTQAGNLPGLSPVQRQTSMPMDASVSMLAAGVLDYPSLLKQWLSPIDFQLERLQLQKTRIPGTFDWLVTTDGQFTRWLKSTTPESSVLWLCDRPGVGKSIATSLILQAVETHCHSHRSSFAYIFGKRANKLNPAPQAIDFIKSLAFQIFRSHPATDGQPPQGSETYLRNGSQMPTMEQAVEFLGEVLKNRRAYLVVDGIDECLQPSEVLEAILELPTVMDGSTRVLISSRMRPDAFDPDGLYPVVRLTPQSGNYSADLRIYVEEEMSKIEGFHRRSERFNEAISKVIAASDGNFQWASALLVDLKLAQAQGRFWESITAIPNEIKILVKQELWKIWQKPESKRRLMLEALEWTIFCMEPLTVGSFPFGRVFDSDGSFLDYEHRRIDRSRFLLRFGTEFLIFPTLDGKFELFHHRLADYILLTTMEESPQFQLTDGPTRLAFSTVRYLSSPSFQESLNSESYQHTGLHTSQPGGAKSYLRSKYRCLEYSSRHLVHHLLKVSDVTTEDGSELVSTLITFFLSTNAVTWVEAAQVFDTSFARKFVNQCPDLTDWITSVFAVHPRWRDSLHAVTTRLDQLQYYVNSSGAGLVAPPPTRPRATTFDSPSIQISSYPEEQQNQDTSISRARSRSPRGISSLLTTFTGGARHEENSRSPQRRTREEVERGVERRSPARNTFPTSNTEVRRRSTGAVSNALAIANASATGGAVPFQYHYPGRENPCPGWGHSSQSHSPPQTGAQHSYQSFPGSSHQQYGGTSPPQQQWYPMQEYYGLSFQQESYSEPPPPYMRYG